MCESDGLSYSGWHGIDPNSLRWAKQGKPVLQAVPIGATVRAEVVDPPMEPSGFRIWRSASLVSRLFTRVRHPTPVLVLARGGWDDDIFFSEDFNTGSNLDWKSQRFEFDLNSAKPRSRELAVVPHTKVERYRSHRAVLSGEIGASSELPAKAGIKSELGADGSTRWNYVLTAAVDPELEARLLVPWGENHSEFEEYFIALLSTDAAEVHSADAEMFHQGAREYLRVLVPAHEPTATLGLWPASLSLSEGEQQWLTVTVHAHQPGMGLFAIQLVDREGRTSTSDPWLYAISEDRKSIVIYDAVVKDYDEEMEEGADLGDEPVAPKESPGESLRIEPIEIDFPEIAHEHETTSTTEPRASEEEEEMEAGA